MLHALWLTCYISCQQRQEFSSTSWLAPGDFEYATEVSILQLLWQWAIMFSALQKKEVMNRFAQSWEIWKNTRRKERRDAINRRVHANCRKFNNAKCKMLHLGWGNTEHKNRLGQQGTESSPVEKNSRNKKPTWASSVFLHPGRFGLHQKRVGQQRQGCDDFPALKTSWGVCVV